MMIQHPDELQATGVIDDPPPDFEARDGRLIHRADALSYALPMLAPDGSRCYVTLVGSFAVWGACVTALVHDGWEVA